MLWSPKSQDFGRRPKLNSPKSCDSGYKESGIVDQDSPNTGNPFLTMKIIAFALIQGVSSRDYSGERWASARWFQNRRMKPVGLRRPLANRVSFERVMETLCHSGHTPNFGSFVNNPGHEFSIPRPRRDLDRRSTADADLVGTANK